MTVAMTIVVVIRTMIAKIVYMMISINNKILKIFLIQTCQAKRPEDIVNHCLSAREYRVGVDMVGRN